MDFLTIQTFHAAMKHKEISAPGTPEAGFMYVYFKTDHILYTKNPAGTEVSILSSASAIAQSQVTNLVSDLAAKAPLASPTFTGTPAAPTASAGTSTTQLATTAYVMGAIADLVASSPSTLDTLNEIAAALADDPNFATTMTTALSNKQPLDATLTALAGVTVAADKMIYATGADAFAATDLSSFARTLLDDANAAAARSTLELGSLSTLNTVGTSQITDGAVTEAKLGLGDNTTANASTSAHGLLKKLDNDATHFMNGQGEWVAVSTSPVGQALTGGYIWVGNGSNQAAAVAMSGDATLSSTGALTIANDAITTAKIATNAVTWQELADGAVMQAKIQDLAVVTSKIFIDADFSVENHKVTNVATPTSANDAANKSYVDNLAAGLDPKGSCRVATTANITLSGAQTIDGISVVAGNRVLVKNQTTGSENGIWVCASGAWSRATDADTSAEVTSGMYCFVTEGSTQAGTGWVLTTADPITLGTTSLTFTQFNGGTTYVEGTGVNIVGNVISLDFGSGAGNVCEGNDSRLSDTRTPTDATVTEAKLNLADNTTADASTTKHGLLPKLPGGTTNFLREDGTWAEPAGGGGSGTVFPSPNHRYKFDENTGTAGADSGVATHVNATDVAGWTTSGLPTLAENNVSAAYRATNGTLYTIPGDIVGTGNQWTITGWFKRSTGSGGCSCGILRGNAATNPLIIYLWSTDEFKVAGSSTITLAGVAPADTLVFFAVRKNGTSYDIFIDGVLDDSGTITSFTPSTSYQGDTNTNNCPLMVDDLRIYNGLLTDAQIEGIFNAEDTLTGGGLDSSDSLLYNFMAHRATGRVTLATVTPVTLTDQAAKTTLYYTPWNGATIGVPSGDGANWQLITYSEKSLKSTDTQTGTTTNGAATITGLTDTTQLVRGMQVTGTGVAASSTIASIDSATQVTLNNNATASGSVSITFKLPPRRLYVVYGTVGSNGALQLRFGREWTWGGAGALLYGSGTPGAGTGSNGDYYIDEANGYTYLKTAGAWAKRAPITLDIPEGSYLQDGIRVNTNQTASGDSNNIAAKTGRVLAYVYTTSTAGQMEDSITFRGICNRENKVERPIFVCPGYSDNNSATTYTVNSASYVEANSGSGWLIWFVSDGESPSGGAVSGVSGGSYARFGVGEDSHTNVTAEATSTGSMNGTAVWQITPTTGYHFIGMLIQTGGSQTIYADVARNGSATDNPATYIRGYIMG